MCVLKQSRFTSSDFFFFFCCRLLGKSLVFFNVISKAPFGVVSPRPFPSSSYLLYCLFLLGRNRKRVSKELSREREIEAKGRRRRSNERVLVLDLGPSPVYKSECPKSG